MNQPILFGTNINFLQISNRKQVAATLFSLEDDLYCCDNSIEQIKLFLIDLFLQMKENIKKIDTIHKKIKQEKNKKPVDKMKLAGRIIAIMMIILMLFSVCGTLMFYLMQG